MLGVVAIYKDISDKCCQIYQKINLVASEVSFSPQLMHLAIRFSIGLLYTQIVHN